MRDDPYGRTGLAWMRTVLGSVVVCALVARGLVIGGMPGWAVAAAMVPAAAFLALGAARIRSLRRQRDAGAWHPGTAAAVTALLGLVALASIAGLASSA